MKAKHEQTVKEGLSDKEIQKQILELEEKKAALEQGEVAILKKEKVMYI